MASVSRRLSANSRPRRNSFLASAELVVMGILPSPGSGGDTGCPSKAISGKSAKRDVCFIARLLEDGAEWKEALGGEAVLASSYEEFERRVSGRTADPYCAEWCRLQ